MHALEIIHDLLVPDGRLIDIHPTGEKPSIEVVSAYQRELAGFIDETDDFVEYSQAEAALLGSVVRGRFCLERRETFRVVNSAADIHELHNYLTENWKDAILEASLITRAQSLAAGFPRPSHVEVTEEVVISLLKPLVPANDDLGIRAAG